MRQGAIPSVIATAYPYAVILSLKPGKFAMGIAHPNATHPMSVPPLSWLVLPILARPNAPTPTSQLANQTTGVAHRAVTVSTIATAPRFAPTIL